MNKIPSFQKNHNILSVGLHAQTDAHGITTFDLRFKKPNAGNYFSAKAMHTIEHLMATVLRNGPAGENIVYFGPMGCRTGFYLLTVNLTYSEVRALLKASIPEAIALKEIPGAKKTECGNYLEHDQAEAKQELAAYLEILNRF